VRSDRLIHRSLLQKLHRLPMVGIRAAHFKSICGLTLPDAAQPGARPRVFVPRWRAAYDMGRPRG